MSGPGDRPARAGSETLALLAGASAGDEAAASRLMVVVYDELRALARRYLRGERGGHTLQPTALVHEAYVRLAGGSPVKVADRNHFFALAARAMREVLVDHARRRAAAKRQPGGERVTLDDALGLAARDEPRQLDLLVLDEAMVQLERLEPRQARVIELRFFGGLTIDETAAVLGVSTDTVEDDSAMSRAWLARRLRVR